MMIASIPIGADMFLDVSGFTAAEIVTPLVELRGDPLRRPLNMTPDQATELAAALVTAACRAQQENML